MKKICIVTTDVILAYQPTILNLYDQLIKHFEVEIISFEPGYISDKKITDRNVLYLKEPAIPKKILSWLDFGINITSKRILKKVYRNFYYNNYFSKRLTRKALEAKLKNIKTDIFIVVDYMALLSFQNVLPERFCHFLSLEIFENDKHRQLVQLEKVKSVIIQSNARFNFLFPANQLEVFYLQNAPSTTDFCFKETRTKSLIWAGSIIQKFGVLNCIEFIEHYKQFSLTLKGGGEANFLLILKKKFHVLVEQGLLVIDNSYLTSNDFINYIADFKIGFCFYDIELTKVNFNYRTAPSGKLFAYYAASVPVIALNIPGLQSVTDFKTGVLIDDYNPSTIFNAIIEIEENYKFYSDNCRKASVHFAFDTNCQKLISYLLKSQ